VTRSTATARVRAGTVPPTTEIYVRHNISAEWVGGRRVIRSTSFP
jgi:hypothetical protein